MTPAPLPRKAIVADLHALGLTERQIAERSGIEVKTVAEYRWRLGLACNRAESRATPIDEATVRALAAQGITQAAIASLYGVTAPIVSLFMTKHGIAPAFPLKGRKRKGGAVSDAAPSPAITPHDHSTTPHTPEAISPSPIRAFVF